MRKNKLIPALAYAALFLLASNAHAFQKIDTIKVDIDWNNIQSTSKTTPTLQLVENPLVRANTPVHAATFSALKNLGADYVRYVPWFPYPKLAVAELKPPADGKTSWDFSLLDSTMDAFMEATKGHSVVVNFSTTPAWMWKTEKPVDYPDNAYQTDWNYNQGTVLRDTTIQQLADYYARLLSWYTKGGFTDELGAYHKSGHYFKIQYWEVLNEVEAEHSMSPQTYTKIYDAIVTAMHKVDPNLKFIGMALAYESNPEFFEYFLNPKNHKAGVPVDGISYHHYSSESYSGQALSGYQYTFFESADAFINTVRYIEAIRKRLSPNTITTINELGTFLGADPIPDDYWNLAGAMYAHLFLEFSQMGIDVAGESQLVGFPTQFPDVSMINWKNGNPNSRYWVLKLLIDNFGPGDKLAATGTGWGSPVDGQAYITKNGKKLLLINRQDKDVRVMLPAGALGGTALSVDTSTRENPPAEVSLAENSILLKAFSVTVVDYK
jgi:hypothetical protein